MNKLKDNYLRLAIQKKGRLTEETISLLRSSGLEFESYKQNLFSTCRNFPLEILFLRDDDIPNYIKSGAADIGIVGQNLLFEKTAHEVKEILQLDFGYCTLALAVPKDSKYKTIQDLQNCKIATSYPNSTRSFFKKNSTTIDIVNISGSVEIAPALKMADAIVDLVATGSTLALNDLRILETVYTSQSVLVGNKNLKNNVEKKQLLDKLILRFKAVAAAETYKYIMMNAPLEILPEIQRVVPGLKSPTIAPLANKGWISIQTVVKEDLFWETIEQLKKLGASGIIALPIEKLIV